MVCTPVSSNNGVKHVVKVAAYSVVVKQISYRNDNRNAGNQTVKHSTDEVRSPLIPTAGRVRFAEQQASFEEGAENNFVFKPTKKDMLATRYLVPGLLPLLCPVIEQKFNPDYQKSIHSGCPQLMPLPSQAYR